MHQLTTLSVPRVSLVPRQAPSFYWEIEIVSYGDSEEDSGPIVSFGFATEAEKRDGAWTNPVGTCLFHKYGPHRLFHPPFSDRSIFNWSADGGFLVPSVHSLATIPLCLSALTRP